MAQARRLSPLDDQAIWRPQPGWVLTRPGVWMPQDYHATRWELQAPSIHNLKESREDWIKCSKSLPYFAFRHCWTLDVDDPTGISVRKIPAYPYLRRFFTEAQTPQNIHCEKSRQMIMSWAWMVVFEWDILFRKHWTSLVVSKRSKDVDDGGINSTPDSNFGKLRFVHAHLPEHLWVYGEFKKFQIRIPSNHSHVKGETGKGSAASRGPAYKRALMDEAAYVDRSETVFKGLRQAAKTGTALNSTPNGKGNVFARIRFSKITTFRKLSFHWSEHPRKAVGLYCICGWKAKTGVGLTQRDQFFKHDCPLTREVPSRSPEMRSPWYDREAQDLTPEQVASELDISYEKSRRGRVWSQFDQTRNVWPIMERLGPKSIHETAESYQFRYLKLVLNRRWQPFVLWDFGVGDPTAMLFGQIMDDAVPRVRFLDEIEESDKSYDFFGTIVNTVWLEAVRATGNQLAILHYGDPSGKNRESDLMSWVTNLAGMTPKIKIGTAGGGAKLAWLDYINHFGFGEGNIIISDWCSGMIDAVQNYHFPLDEKGEMIPGKHEPVHDEWSHKCDALRYLYRNRYTNKLTNRRARGVTLKKMLARGAGYDRRLEHRQF